LLAEFDAANLDYAGLNGEPGGDYAGQVLQGRLPAAS
jgi:hypothetical protein